MNIYIGKDKLDMAAHAAKMAGDRIREAMATCYERFARETLLAGDPSVAGRLIVAGRLLHEDSLRVLMPRKPLGSRSESFGILFPPIRYDIMWANETSVR